MAEMSRRHYFLHDDGTSRTAFQSNPEKLSVPVPELLDQAHLSNGLRPGLLEYPIDHAALLELKTISPAKGIRADDGKALGVFRLLLVITLFLGLFAPGAAHSEQEDTVMVLSLSEEKVVLEYFTSFPSAGGFTRLREMDGNGDEQYSEEERTRFLDQRANGHLAQLRVEQDGKPLKVAVVKQEAIIDSNVVGLNKLSVHYVLEGSLLAPPEEGKTTISIVDPVVGWNEVERKGHAGSLEGDIPGDVLKVVYGQSGEQTHAHHDDSHSEEQLMGMVAGELTLSALLATLGGAFILGALHALTPGHGKTLVAAYLVGSRGTVKQAVLLGIVVTVTHTLSVFLLGIACLFAFQYVVPEKVIPWLGFFSGLLVTAVGVALIWARATGRELFHGHSHENGHGHSHGHSHSHSGGHSHSHSSGHSHSQESGHSHDSGHSHSHESGHSHAHAHESGHSGENTSLAEGPQEREPEELSHHSHAHHDHDKAEEGTSEPSTRSPESPKEGGIGLWALISLGVSGGMVPCPEALVVLLGAISLNRLMLGMAVLVAFSLGLASLLILVGIFVVLASKKASSKYYPSEETIRRVSIVAYCFICVLGLVIAIRSLTTAGILVLNL